MEVISTTTGQSGDIDIATHEVWTYDEVDDQQRHVRCVREESDQTYTLRKMRPTGLAGRGRQATGHDRTAWIADELRRTPPAPRGSRI